MRRGGAVRYWNNVNVYRNHYLGRENRSKGYSFHANTVTANAAKKEPPKGTVEVEQDTIEIALNKQGLLEALPATPATQNNK